MTSFRTRKKKIKINVIPCYAPTNDNEEETKDQFYNRLHNMLEKRPEKEPKLLLGVFSAKTGLYNTR